MITVGGYDEDYFEGEIFWVPISKAWYWQVVPLAPTLTVKPNPNPNPNPLTLSPSHPLTLTLTLTLPLPLPLPAGGGRRSDG